MPSTALNVGTIWHLAQEIWATDAMENDGVPTTRLVAQMRQAFDRTVAALGEAATYPQAAYELAEQWTLLEAMAINYEGYWKKPLEDDYIMIQPEQTVVISVPGTEHCPKCGLDPDGHAICTRCDISVELHRLEGTLDGLIKNTRNGLAYVLERKTYGAKPNEETLQFGDQYVAYLWILQQLGFQCGGVAYDGAWKRAAPPKGKTIDDLFLRYVITRNQAEIDEFGRFLPQELNDMEAARNDPSLRYYNRRWEGCWDCSYRSPCQAESRGEGIDLDSYTPRQPKERASIWPVSKIEGYRDSTVSSSNTSDNLFAHNGEIRID